MLKFGILKCSCPTSILQFGRANTSTCFQCIFLCCIIIVKRFTAYMSSADTVTLISIYQALKLLLKIFVIIIGLNNKFLRSQAKLFNKKSRVCSTEQLHIPTRRVHLPFAIQSVVYIALQIGQRTIP